MQNKLSNQTLKLRSERLRFDSWCIDDLPLMLQLHTDPKVQAGYPYDADYWTNELIAKKLDSYMDEQNNHGVTKWKLSLLDGTFIGRAGWSFWNDNLELGYAILPQFQGKGFAFEAAAYLLQESLKTYEAKKLVGFAAVNNKASQAVLEKIGLHYEGEQDIDGHPSAFYRAAI